MYISKKFRLEFIRAGDRMLFNNLVVRNSYWREERLGLKELDKIDKVEFDPPREE